MNVKLTNQRPLRWTKPPSTWKKLNVDGSCKNHQNAGAFGVVLRDDTGQWIWGFAAQIGQPTFNEAKLERLLRGLELSWEQRIQKLQVEVDSETIFDWVTDHAVESLGS